MNFVDEYPQKMFTANNEPMASDWILDKVRTVGEPVFLGCGPIENAEIRSVEGVTSWGNFNENNKTMDYRVTTDILESIDKGDLLKKSRYKSDIFIHRPTKKKFTLDSLLRNPDWFEPVEEVQEGQYRFCTRNKKPYRINKRMPDGRYVILWLYEYGNDCTELVSKISLEGDRKLSTPEIEQALVDEAKRRGLAPGNKVKTPCGFEYTLSGNPYEYKYKADLDRLYSSGVLIYDNGEWAQIVDQTPDIEINGNKVEFNDHPKVGCTTIKKEVFIEQAKTIARHGVRVHRKGEDITDQILAIASHYGYEDEIKYRAGDTIIMGTLEDVTFSDQNMWGNND